MRRGKGVGSCQESKNEGKKVGREKMAQGNFIHKPPPLICNRINMQEISSRNLYFELFQRVNLVFLLFLPLNAFFTHYFNGATCHYN